MRWHRIRLGWFGLMSSLWSMFVLMTVVALLLVCLCDENRGKGMCRQVPWANWHTVERKAAAGAEQARDAANKAELATRRFARFVILATNIE